MGLMLRRANRLLDRLYGPVPGSAPVEETKEEPRNSTEKLLRLLARQRRQARSAREGM